MNSNSRLTESAGPFAPPPPVLLRYLAEEVGKDVIRSQGHRPCSELDKPLLCRPDGA
ncbi:hypothetical protein ACFWR9_20240 [Streptomyces sp. NPDC058534]|uniref:hypothetical protein n=1 Tax=Streptomyces sp. NPDC058534 TaxID=3346541 RepID=UPI003663A766